ncbi:MAG: cation diffusion facilitator family transporter [Mollicutes bacterium]|nr:cation diffusion facilitator family transporter [Mollicutes bacterium]
MNRFKSTKLASIFGISGNILLMIIKGIVALLTGSQAMTADAFNSAGDIFSSLMTYIGNKISSKPSDEDHNLGHGKAEYIYSMLISISMILMAMLVLKDSFISLVKGKTYDFSVWLIVVCLTTIIVKLLLFIYTNKLYKKYNNLLVKANSKDHFNDMIITSVNLISCLLSLKGIYFLDGVVGIIISLWIMYTSIKLFIESYNVLMDKSISIETKNEVYEIIDRHKEVKKVIHFNSTPVGYKYQISFTIYVDGNMSTFDSHDIANKLEKEIIKEIEEIYLVIIHVNPI